MFSPLGGGRAASIHAAPRGKPKKQAFGAGAAKNACFDAV